MTSLQVGDEAEIDEALGFLVNRGVDGLIAVAPSTGIARAAVRAARGVPMVVVADGFAPSEHIHVVSVDQGLGAGMAVRHLAGRGRSRIAHIAGPGDWFDARARAAGWRAALDGPGRPPQAPRRGQHRHRPRAGRLVLVTGDHGRAAPMSRARHAPQRDAA